MAKISVIMGIYNCEKTLSTAIDSILNQTYTDWELIMCDDCSKDGTYDVANEYAKQYPDKIKLIRNEQNKMLSYTLNRCLEHATGEYIARMDGDDISTEDRFEKQIKFLEEHPEYQLVSSVMQRFSDEGLSNVAPKPEIPDKFSILASTPFNHATIMTYKYVYDSLGGYIDEDRTIRCEDYDLWFRFFAKGYKGYNIQEPLYLVREDLAAIKRRTIKNRLRALKTTKVGYKLLGFPKRYYIKSAIRTYFKCLIPASMMLKYRKREEKAYYKKQGKDSK